MSDRVELLRAQLDFSFDTVRQRLRGLGDDEFFWEPVPSCWSVRPTEGSTSPDAARSKCGWYLEEGFTGAGYDVPEPAPFTTIAWKLVHMGSCAVMYHEHAFGERRDLWGELVPSTADDAVALWTRGRRLLSDELSDLGDADLDAPVRTNWGETWPAWRIFWAITHHDLQHGSEIACVRDLYSNSTRQE
jgi:hypothetical protein